MIQQRTRGGLRSLALMGLISALGLGLALGGCAQSESTIVVRSDTSTWNGGSMAAGDATAVTLAAVGSYDVPKTAPASYDALGGAVYVTAPTDTE